MRKADLNTVRFNLFRKLLICGILILVGGFMFEVYASDILEGTPQSESGATVYKAIVEPNQTYTAVYGVRDNTDFSSYGNVIINKGIVTGTVYGARAISGDDFVRADNNVVDIKDSNIGTVYGGYAYGGSNNARVHSNKVKINGGTITGYIYGGSSDGTTISVSDNKVEISNAQIGRTVYGGCAFNTESWLSMIRNQVVIENSTVNASVYGGYASGSSTASNSNTVTIRANTNIKGSIYGGYALSNLSDAKNNTVIIEDGTVNGRIYGGIGRNASNNTVVVKGGDLSNADLYGYSDGRKSHNENTLELWAANTKVKSASHFENYFFFIPEGIVNQEDKFMLKVDSPVILNDTNVGVAVQNGTELHVDDKINLIDKTEGSPTLVTLDGRTLKGGTLLTKYDFNLSSSEGALVATVLSDGRPLLLNSTPEPAGQAYSEAKSLTEGQVASSALLGRGNELSMGQALSDADAAVHAALANGKTVTSFLTVDYGRADYYTDSHIKMSNADIIAGIAKGFANSDTEKLLGLYFESGYGNYSTFNSFESSAIFGKGNAHYYGGGLMFQIEPSNKNGLYFQTLGRIGLLKNNWSTDDFFKEKVSYDTRQLYYGASAGVGYQNKIGSNVCYDVSCKFMWTHQNGNNADIQGENVQFQDINSQKTRIGLKVAYDGLKIVRPYVGITWEKEFNAVAHAKVNNLQINAADLKGNSGILEIGATYKPERSETQRLDFAANFYFGVRSELRGSVLYTINF